MLPYDSSQIANKLRALVVRPGQVIMDRSSWTQEAEADLDPMLAEQFQIALDATKIRIPELREACRDVLVEGLEPPEAAARRKIDDVTSIYRAITTIKERWKQICVQEEWEYLPFAFPKTMTKLILELQREHLRQYSARNSGRKRSAPRKKKT